MDKLNLTRHENIALRKQMLGYKDRHIRKIEKFSESFNTIFFFFLKSYREGILTFGGSLVEVQFNQSSHSCRECFKRFDDGQFKNTPITSRHPNIVQGVIMAKKSWGLFCKMWTDGIVEGTFTKSEIFSIFDNYGIVIPEQFKNEFENLLYTKRLEYYERYKQMENL